MRPSGWMTLISEPMVDKQYRLLILVALMFSFCHRLCTSSILCDEQTIRFGAHEKPD